MPNINSNSRSVRSVATVAGYVKRGQVRLGVGGKRAGHNLRLAIVSRCLQRKKKTPGGYRFVIVLNIYTRDNCQISTAK